jgi:hypothetical protein
MEKMRSGSPSLIADLKCELASVVLYPPLLIVKGEPKPGGRAANEFAVSTHKQIRSASLSLSFAGRKFLTLSFCCVGKFCA